jgi:predicted nucleic acid-binding protein
MPGLRLYARWYRSGRATQRYETILSRSRGLTLVELDHSLLRAAAQLRALHGLRTPDALQVAAGLMRRCGCFITNDRRLPHIPNLAVIQLRDYL